MRRVVVFLLLTAILIAFAWWLADLPGSVGANIGDLSVNMPTSWAVLGFIVLIVLIYLVIRIVVMIIRLPSRTKRMRSARAQNAGNQAVTRTLLALAGGDAETAQRQAQRSRALLGDTPQTLLLAAYAGRQAGQLEQADEAFNLLATRKDAAFLGLRGLLQGAIARGEWDKAAALARQAEEVNPGAPWLRVERARLATRAGDWKSALSLSGPGDPLAAIGTAAADAETDPAQARRLAKRAWQADPSFTPAALSYARRLREAGREKRAMEVLRLTWAAAPHPDLAEAFLANSLYPTVRADRVETLVAAAPDHAESHLLRARAALEFGDLRAARRYADSAVQGGLEQRRVWLLLAEIAEREGDSAAASQALHRAAGAADPQWRCEACSTVYAAWQPACSQCGTVGRIAWGEAGAQSTRLQLTAGDAILP